jgi:hypothetical protein
MYVEGLVIHITELGGEYFRLMKRGRNCVVSAPAYRYALGTRVRVQVSRVDLDGRMGLTKTASLDGRKYDIAVGQVDVGNAGTEMAMRMAKGVPQANGEIAVEPLMDVSVVGQSVLYMANLPLEANVMFHTVMATKMPFAGRG